MKVIHKVSELKTAIKEVWGTKKIALVPTMGALHDGHRSLIKKAAAENDFCVVSVFVNPVQFGINEDFDKYPRTLELDTELCKSEGVDILFAPPVSEMYTKIYFDEKETTLVCPPYSYVNKLCGKSRPGHFDGVCTVVAKLFNLTKCSRAYFGKKDAQQLFIIKKMVQELNFDVEIVPCPIVREPDGLAISSRNTYLNENDRKLSVNIYKALSTVKELSKNGIDDSKTLIDTALCALKGFEVDYIEVVSIENFAKIGKIIVDGSLMLIAAKTPDTKVRLIDNIEL